MKLLKWIIAQNTNARVWRVTYRNDGEKTYLLSKREAKPLSQIFNGELWIDYSCKNFF